MYHSRSAVVSKVVVGKVQLELRVQRGKTFGDGINHFFDASAREIVLIQAKGDLCTRNVSIYGNRSAVAVVITECDAK